MTDKEKLTALRAEIERRISSINNREHKIPADKVAVIQLEAVLSLYDSLPEEPVSNPTPNKKMSVERWKKACEAACCDSNYRSHYGLTETRDDYFVDGVQWADEHPKEEPISEEWIEELRTKLDSMSKEDFKKVFDKYAVDFNEEPVSEDLEQAACNYGDELDNVLSVGVDDDNTVGEYAAQAYKAGAQWQKEQFEKNRLAACNRQTEEEAEREQDFVMGIIENEHRQPTFDDAIKYGMRLQKEKMKKDAVLCGVDGWFINNKRNCRKNGRFHKYYVSTITHDKKLPMENGKDYRLIVIKED